MKKIIATVLAMVMALALCTTAFAADTVTAKAYRDTGVAGDATVADVQATFHAAVAAKVNKDGEQTNTANLAHYTVDLDAYASKTYVVVKSLADADLVLYGDADAKSVMLYLAEAVVSYDGTGKAFTNFGDTCGKVDYADYDKTKTYYTTNDAGDDAIYVADEDGTKALMVNGALVTVDATPVVADSTTTVQHTVIPTVVDGKITGYTCSVCKVAAVKAANVASIPEGAQVVTGTTYYFPVAGTSAGTTGTTTSPKTFDAGIAMYVGMALTSVAGSAVVIGKKKEF